MFCFVFIIASLIPILRICPFVMKFVNKITNWKLLQQIVKKIIFLRNKNKKSVAYVRNMVQVVEMKMNTQKGTTRYLK